jgi:hypothetical protein
MLNKLKLFYIKAIDNNYQFNIYFQRDNVDIKYDYWFCILFLPPMM